MYVCWCIWKLKSLLESDTARMYITWQMFQMMQQCTGDRSIKALRLYERTSVIQSPDKAMHGHLFTEDE